MKRPQTFILTGLLIILTGCSKLSSPPASWLSATTPPNIVEILAADHQFTATLNSDSFPCQIILDVEKKQDLYTITTISPAEIADISAVFQGNSLTVSYDDINYTVPLSQVPSQSILVILYQILETPPDPDSLVTTNNITTQTGNIGYTSYTLTWDKNGSLSTAILPSLNTEITISNFSTLYDQNI